MKGRRLRFWLYRWHRRGGLAAAVIIILVTVSGIALNHTGDLELDSYYPQSSLLLWPYESAIEIRQGISTKDGWLHVFNQQVLLDAKVLGECSRLIGFASTDREMLLVCEEQWLLLNSDWTLLELIDPAFFQLEHIKAIGSGEQRFAVQVDSGHWYVLDLETYSALLLSKADFISVPYELTSLPLSVDSSRNKTISWQRLLLDMHSGRWLGKYGVWLVDLAAIILLFLALSGCWIWFSKARKS